MFEGEGFLHNQVNAAIKNVTVTTEKCDLLPYFAKPGYICRFSFLHFFLCVADFEHDKIELLKLTKKKGTIITDITDSLNSDKIKRYIKFARI